MGDGPYTSAPPRATLEQYFLKSPARVSFGDLWYPLQVPFQKSDRSRVPTFQFLVQNLAGSSFMRHLRHLRKENRRQEGDEDPQGRVGGWQPADDYGDKEAEGARRGGGKRSGGGKGRSAEIRGYVVVRLIKFLTPPYLASPRLNRAVESFHPTRVNQRRTWSTRQMDEARLHRSCEIRDNTPVSTHYQPFYHQNREKSR